MTDGSSRQLPEATVDGEPAGERPRDLAEGLREIRSPKDVRPVVLWVGPNLRGIPDLDDGDHRRLFVNWY